MEDGKLRGKTEENGPKWQKPGWGGRNIASVSFHQLPRTLAGVRDMCGREMEDGKL